MSPQTSSPLPPGNRVEAARQGRRVPVVALAAVALVVVVVVAAVVIVLVGGGDDGGEKATPGPTSSAAAPGATDDDPAADDAFGPVAVGGELLPDFPGRDEDDPAVGEAAPSLVGETPDGEALTLPGDGPVVLAFVAHWCPHCQAEVPRIVDLADGSDEIDGVKLVAVATGSDPEAPNYPPSEWLAGEDWPGPVLLDDGGASAATAYGLTGYPFLVAIDGDGDVTARSSGELGDDGLRDFFADAASSA